MIRSTSAVVLALALFALPSCGGNEEGNPQKPNPEGNTSAKGAFDGLWSESALGESRTVWDVRKSAEGGEKVVVEGKLKDFVSGRAVFTLVDLKMRSCDEIPGDNCKTPWDYCCMDSKEMAENSVSVEVVDKDGRPLRKEIKGFRSLDHLDVLQVKGSVQRDEAGNVRVQAERIARKSSAK